MKRVGIISIDLVAGTAKFQADMTKASAKVKEFGSHSVSSVQAASGAIRTIEGNVQNNVRAVERFMVSTLKLGPVLQAAFPLVGGIAFAGMVFKIGEEFVEFFKKMEQAPERVAGAFRDLAAPLKMTNDELQVTNDRLANDIAKLEGRRQNTLKLALDEAVVAADKLAASLDKDLSSLNKLLKEENVSWVRQLLGEAGTDDISRELGGETGYGGFAGRLAEKEDAGNAKISAAKTVEAQKAARAELDAALKKAYADEIGWIDGVIAKSQKLQEARKKALPVLPKGQAGMVPGGAFAPAPFTADDQTVRLKVANRVRANLSQEARGIGLQSTNASLTARKEADEAAAANAALGRPFADKMKAFAVALDAVKAKLAAIGGSQSELVLAKAFGESEKAIEEVNKALEHQHKTLTANEQGQIGAAALSYQTAEAQAEWKAKLVSTTAEIRDQVESYRQLTAAIGKGYAAVKSASVETQVMHAVGGEKYADKDWMAAHAKDVAGLRSNYGSQYDAQQNLQTGQATDSIGDQIALERSLAEVQMQGAEAVRLKTLEMHLDILARAGIAGATKKQIEALRELDAATRANLAAGELAKLNEHVDAVKRLAAAQMQGVEAVRKAGLESKYAEMKRAGAAPEVITATRTSDEAEHQEQITARVAERVNVYRRELEALDEEEAKLLDIKASQGDSLSIERALRDIENERLKIAVQQTLAGRTARDGVRAFFIEMQQQAKSSAEIIYDALNSALDRVSDQFAKLITGQKTDFGKMFQEIGATMIKDSVKSALQSGIGAIAGAFGINVPDIFKGKPDGSSAPKALWVRIAGGSPTDDGQTDASHTGAGGQCCPMPAAAKAKTGPGFGGFLGSVLGGLVGGFLGGGVFGGLGGAGGGEDVSSTISYGEARAAGGQVSASQAYLVGENGPEILTGASGRISSNADSRRILNSANGDTHNYSIDARGTDPVQTEMRVRNAIKAAHDSAVSTGVRVSADRIRRMPSPAPA